MHFKILSFVILNTLRNLKTKNRITYIDSLRSIAIIMVLEGHFITQSLQTKFRDDHNVIYSSWKFTRCLTAPTFLFISGLIFTYLLLNNNKNGLANTRLQKGFVRSLKVIGFGYLLQLNLYSYFFLNKPFFTDLFKIFHILQCIGTSLLIISILYLFKNYILNIRLGILTFLMGFIFFAGSLTLHQKKLSFLPQFIENMLIVTKTYSKPSIFPLFHWAGFVMFGATLGSIFYNSKKIINSYLLPLSTATIGFILIYNYHHILHYIYSKINNTNIVDFSYVFEFKRLGQVLIAISLFIFLHKISKYLKPLFKFIPWNQSLFIKIGQNTLSIFVLHVIILYRGFLGWRINTLTSKKLTPWQSILGAILFIAFFVLWVKYIDFIKQAPLKLYKKINLYVIKRKRLKNIIS